MKNIKLLVSTYKAPCEQIGDFVVPVSSGAALYEENDVLCKTRDDSGDNISDKNRGYCELTAQYWAYKNLECDVCGIMHRRRYFDFSEKTVFDKSSKKLPPAYRIFDIPDKKTLSTISLNKETAIKLTDKYKIIASVRENIYQSVRSYYNKNDRSGFDDLELLSQIVKDKYPELAKSTEDYLDGHYCYFCNMFIMDKVFFDEYSRRLFDVLFEYEKQKPKELFYPREQGKLGERFFGIYMNYIINHTDVSWAEIPRAHFCRIDGMTPRNFSFNKKMYTLFPPGSMRRGIIRKIK